MNLLQNFVYSFGLNLNNFDARNFNQAYGLNLNLNQTDEAKVEYEQEASQGTFENNKKEEEMANTSLDSSPTTSPNMLKNSGCEKRESFFPLIENKRIRNMFSTNQIEILEKVFEQTHYPDSAIREQLSSRLNLNIMRIQVWFQNRRAKYRKMDIEQRKSLNSSGNKKSLKLANSLKPKKEEKVDSPPVKEVEKAYSPILTPQNLISAQEQINRQLLAANSYQFQNQSALFDFHSQISNQQIFPHHFQTEHYHPHHQPAQHQQYQQQQQYEAYLQSKYHQNSTEQFTYTF